MATRKPKKRAKNNTRKKIIPHPNYVDDYNTIYKKFVTDKMILTDSLLINALNDETDKEKKTTAKPEQDFYSHINHLWIKETQKDNLLKGKYYSKYDEYTVTQDKVFDEIIFIAEELMKNNKQLENAYNSAMFRTPAHDACFEVNLKTTIAKIDEFITADDLYGLLAYINKYEIVSPICPILWKCLPDVKNPTIYRNYISIPSLPVNTPYYTEKSKYGTTVLSELGKTVDKLFAVINKYDTSKMKQTFQPGKKSVSISTLIAETMAKNPSSEFYNVFTPETALKRCGFDFKKFSEKLGHKTPPQMVIIESPEYLKAIMQILQEKWKTPEWRHYWIYMFGRQIIRMHSKHIQIYFNFYLKFVRGADARLSNKVFTSALLSQTFNKIISNEYVKRFSIPENIEFIENFSADLKQIFINILSSNKWLSPTTKKSALLKLEKLKMRLGNNTDAFLDDPIIEYSPVDMWKNLEKIFEWRLTQFVFLADKAQIKQIDFPSVNWSVLQLTGRQPYIVNAFYTPSKNDIYIPIAYMQKPFLDIHNYGIEYNVAHVGTTLAHEMSHALDITGSNYDATGRLKNWWTPGDRAKFDKKVENIVAQYNRYHKNDKIIYDSFVSIGENMADISAVYICEKYLSIFQSQHSTSVPNKYLMFTGFYTYYAIQMRQVLRQKAIAHELVSNPHALDKYRVNIPLSRLPVFQTIYRIRKGDGMYWPDTTPIF